jgi:hypothetical protein
MLGMDVDRFLRPVCVLFLGVRSKMSPCRHVCASMWEVCEHRASRMEVREKCMHTWAMTLGFFGGHC